MAEKWLEGNILNRVIKDRHVKFLADQMKRGMWKQNGSTIKFTSDAILLDGQHRLWACIESKTPFTTLVAEGIDKDAFPTIDTGNASRTAGDVLNIAGHKQNSALIAQAAMHVMNYRTSDLNTFKKRVPRQDVLTFVEANPELLELVTLTRCTKSDVRKQAAVAIAICFMAKKHPQPARNFLRKFMTGEELTAKSPILILRHRLNSTDRLRPNERLALTANAWNAYVANRQITHLKITGSSFPKITGA
jgi:hypothetical protein